MNVLITGGYGFIGSHTVERFYKEGHDIFIIDDLSTGNKDNVSIKHKFYHMNINDKNCEKVFANNKFDIVIHLAAQIDAGASVHNPYFDAQSNILGLINMLELSSKYNVKKFIFSSSAAVYGNNENIPLSEEFDCVPISPYGQSKFSGEGYCKLWTSTEKLDSVCLRFSNVYGPRQSVKGEGGVISIFLNNIFNNKKLIVLGDGNQSRDFIYVEDVVDAIYRSTEYNVSKVINISTNTQSTINTLIDIITDLHGNTEVEYSKPREGDILHSRLSNNKAMNELNWAPIYDFEEGISKTYEWYKDNNKVNDDILKKKLSMLGHI